MKSVAGTMKLDLAQFRELEAFAAFGSDLDKATQAQLARGERLVEVLKQDQYSPLPVEMQIVIIYSATNGFLDPVPTSEVKRYEAELKEYLMNQHSALLNQIRDEKKMTDDIKEKLNAALKEFAAIFQVKKG